MPTTTIITRGEWELNLCEKTGTLLFPDMYYDIHKFVDLKSLRYRLEKKGFEIGSKRIVKVLITTESHPLFVKEANEDVYYKKPMFCNRDFPGAFYSEFCSMWLTRLIAGNVYVLME